MVLHKSKCNGPLTNRSQYLKPINRAFGEIYDVTIVGMTAWIKPIRGCPLDYEKM